MSHIMSLYKTLYESPDLSLEDIKNGIINYFGSETNYCEKILGSGFYGTVSVSNLSDRMKIKVNGKIIELMIVVKKANQQSFFSMDEHNNKLFIYSGTGDMTNEAITLNLLSKLWYDGITPHAPFMITAYKCGSNPQSLIDTIVTEKIGLSEPIMLKRDLFSIYPEEEEKKSMILGTLGELLMYIVKTNDFGSVNLPNGIKADTIELLDALFIGYMHTLQLIWEKFKITLLDQHPGNIFIQWINPETHMGEKSLAQTKKISYDIGSGKYLTLNTYGIILKIGDVGVSYIIPRPDVMIYNYHQWAGPAQPDSVENQLNTLGKYSQPIKTYLQMIHNYRQDLPPNILNKTIVGKLLLKSPFDTFIAPWFIANHDLYPEINELFEWKEFEKYIGKKPPGKNTLMINK